VPEQPVVRVTNVLCKDVGGKCKCACRGRCVAIRYCFLQTALYTSMPAAACALADDRPKDHSVTACTIAISNAYCSLLCMLHTQRTSSSSGATSSCRAYMKRVVALT
jgi:hypothetical protein